MSKVNEKLFELLEDVHKELINTKNAALNEGETSNTVIADIIKEILEMLHKEEYSSKAYLDSTLLGNAYEKFKDIELKKTNGQFYTPNFVIEYIMKKTVAEADVLLDPFIKVLDPACGSGYFLVAAYDILKEKFQKQLGNLQHKFKDEKYEIIKKGKVFILSGKDYWQNENLHYHLLKHCIYGVDIDALAVKLTIINLLKKEPTAYIDELNIVNCDSLIRWEKDYKIEQLSKKHDMQINPLYGIISIDEKGNENKKTASYKEAKDLNKRIELFSNKFDYIIGNPPYIGHKDLSFEHKAFLKMYYKEIFKDKSDISYCFIYRFSSKEILRGKISFITSRYFLESPTGLLLRKYIKNNINIENILDFYGVRILENIGIDPVIFTFNNLNDDLNIKDRLIDVIKVKSTAKKMSADILFKKINDDLPSKYFDRFNIKQSGLKDIGWIFIPKELISIICKIENKCQYLLEDLCESFQGIITGCDKAFIINQENNMNVEKNLQRTWIKNSNIGKYIISRSNLKLIYSDLIKNESQYKDAIGHIYPYKDKLENRRECRKGFRKWYQLQWGRDESIFLGTKIVFPYKAEHNRFAIDSNGCFFSADIYGMKIKDDKISYAALIGILNSKLYEVYFKCFAKKLGDKLYDYYPNTVMRLSIPVDDDMLTSIDNYICKIFNLTKDFKSDKLQISDTNKDTENITSAYTDQIDRILYEYFNLGKNEIKLIEKMYN